MSSFNNPVAKKKQMTGGVRNPFVEGTVQMEALLKDSKSQKL